MIVILEGNDRAGKTTIANALVEEDNFRCVHFGPPETNDFGTEFHVRLLEELIKEVEAEHPRDLVFDRAHLGELVYGPLDRGVTAMTWGQMAQIERVFQGAGAILVWVDTDPIECWGRATGTSDEAPVERFASVHALYEKAYEQSSLMKIRLIDVDSIRKISKWFRV